MNHKEFSSKGGRTMTPKKLEALRINAAKAREARIAKIKSRGGKKSTTPQDDFTETRQ